MRSMTRLRERQKARRRQAILEAAHGLFRERGFDSASMEQIAQRAEVSPGTIYNYFDSKGALLVRIAEHHFRERIRSQWPDTSDPRRDPACILADFIDNLLDWGMEPLDRSLWRSLYAISILHFSRADERAYAVMDRYLLDQIVRLCDDLAANGRLPSGVDPRDLGEIAFAVGNNQWLQFLIYDDVSLGEAKRVMRKQLCDLLHWAASGPARVRARKDGAQRPPPRSARISKARGNGRRDGPRGREVRERGRCA
jgi:AcrR family transcriptional regulator